MKKPLILTAACLAAFALPVAADTGATTTVLGCQIVDKGGYWNKADPTCAFSNEDTRGSRLGYGDLDNDPTTPDSLGPINN